MNPENANLEVTSCGKPRQVKDSDGNLLEVPDSWELLPPGDAALSRRIKKAGPTWTVKEKKGRKLFSKGIWAPADKINQLREELELERQDPAYQKKLDAGRKRREREQAAYAIEFEASVFDYLNFASTYQETATELAKRIATHAVPVGSGTVARTQRIPIEKRAEAATIAWLRPQTTAYDHMVIPKVKGKRREVRQKLAKHSKQLLENFRKGEPRPQDCPILLALGK